LPVSQVFTIRGLPLTTDDIFYNGLYGVLPRQIITTEALERLELFKGPNAFINGAAPGGSGIGGSVNLVPKPAQDNTTRSVTLDYASDSQVGGHVDLGQHLGEDNRFSARVNLAQMDTEQKKNANGLNDGNRAAGVPRFQYNVGADWDGRRQLHHPARQRRKRGDQGVRPWISKLQGLLRLRRSEPEHPCGSRLAGEGVLEYCIALPAVFAAMRRSDKPAPTKNVCTPAFCGRHRLCGSRLAGEGGTPVISRSKPLRR
jgi:hypothetical protein